MSKNINTNSVKIDKQVEEPTHTISLHDFSYSSTSRDTSLFLGREKEIRRLEDHLDKSLTNITGGSFLVSGYRGAGKTRFVNKIVNNFREKYQNHLIDVHINLGSSKKLDSKTILFNIVSLLNDKIEEKTSSSFLAKFYSFIKTKKIQIVIAIAFSFIFIKEIIMDLLQTHINSPDDTFWEILYTVHKKEATLFEVGVENEFVIISLLIIVSIYFLLPSNISALLRLLFFQNEIENLKNEIYSISENSSLLKSKNFSYNEKTITGPLDNNQIESKLKNILGKLSSKKNGFKIIFVFDELDKLTSSINENSGKNIDLTTELDARKQQVDSVLGDLKSLITNSKACFIFIAGREMYDSYLSERGSTNSLYESLFNDHIYIPSLLTDRSNKQVYLLDSMVEAFVVYHLIPKDKQKFYLKDLESSDYLKLGHYIEYRKHCIKGSDYKNYFSRHHCFNKHEFDLLIKENYFLKILIHFLTLHSWGNFKRLITLFESFVSIESPKNNESINYILKFSTTDIQRLVLASNLYIVFHHNLSRILMNADDKLVVSSFSIFHHILKYHSIGFTRENILRMYETINIHGSPELSRVVDMILHNVLKNYIRRVRNGLYRFRFSSLHEKEIHYITNINDNESAAFNFSLNAMDAIKQHFRNLIEHNQYPHINELFGDVALSSIHVILGNFHFWEQSYDEANIHYAIAADILKKDEKSDLDEIGNILQLTEIYLKQGSVAERVGNYAKAASIYIKAESIAEACLTSIYDLGIKHHDSKWDILRQPKWAKHFLNLKRSAIHYLTDTTRKIDIPGTTDITKYREGVFSLFIEDCELAFLRFIEVARSLDYDSERSYYLSGNAYVKAGFSILLQYSNRLHLELKKIQSTSKDEYVQRNNVIKNMFLYLLKHVLSSLKGIRKLVKEKNSLSSFESHLKNGYMCRDSFNEDDQDFIYKAFGLMELSAIHFTQGKLSYNSAVSSLSIVIMWEAILEMIPRRFFPLYKKDQEIEELLQNIREEIQNVRSSNFANNQSFIFHEQNNALKSIGYNTGMAFSHFMKTTLQRNVQYSLNDSLFQHENSLRDMFLNDKFLNSFMYQHQSLFDQVIIASIFMEESSASGVCETVGNIKESLLSNEILPYSTRYYATILWLKGRQHLDEMYNNKYDNVDIKVNDENIQRLIHHAIYAIVNLFRASEYFTKTHGESSGISLPTLWIIYYNMWEVLFRLVTIYKEYKISVEEEYVFYKAVADVRLVLDKKISDDGIFDVSSRVLDLNQATQTALEHLGLIEKMGDQNSTARTSILRNKYYLDDDYEDNMFILDWFYCRFSAPTAFFHKILIEDQMQDLMINWKKNSGPTS